MNIGWSGNAALRGHGPNLLSASRYPGHPIHRASKLIKMETTVDSPKIARQRVNVDLRWYTLGVSENLEVNAKDGCVGRVT
jgi:hypothetical protein